MTSGLDTPISDHSPDRRSILLSGASLAVAALSTGAAAAVCVAQAQSELHRHTPAANTANSSINDVTDKLMTASADKN